MILQTDPTFPEEIHAFGCYFMSVIFLASGITGKVRKADEILAIFKAAKVAGILGKECYVQDPLGLFRLLGVRMSAAVKAGADTMPEDGCFEVLHFHRDADTPKGQGNAVHDHFVVGDGRSAVVYDPLGGSNTVRFGFLENKRVFVR